MRTENKRKREERQLNAMLITVIVSTLVQRPPHNVTYLTRYVIYKVLDENMTKMNLTLRYILNVRL